MSTAFIEPLPRTTGVEPARRAEITYGYPRNFLGQRFVYTVISPRARGLSVGVNVNPDKQCNFDCVYCEVDRRVRAAESRLDLDVMAGELESTLAMVHSGQIQEHPQYARVPSGLLRLQHVCLSGDGEPTLCPNFHEVVESVVHLRARGRFPFFKLVLVTNATGLDRPEVEAGLRLFTPRDEIWAKLEAGTQEYMRRVNKPDCSLESVLGKILRLARERPVVIQSLFPAIEGHAPQTHEIEAYIQRLKCLKEAGAQIPLVQIYSATRPPSHSECRHLPLRALSEIARRVREIAGLKVEVF